MPSYFGYTAGLSYIGINNRWRRNKTYVTGFTCPGSGAQQIVELSLRCNRGDASNRLRLAVFDSARELIAQGSSAFIPPEVNVWAGHMTPATITPYPATLTAGVTYYLAAAVNDSPTGPTVMAGAPGGTDAGTTGVADYATNGFPSTLADGTDESTVLNLRCGVEPYPYIPGGGYNTDDRYRFRPSCLSAFTSTQIRHYSAMWPPSTGILNPWLDALADNDSRLF